jgi:AcrR family transcriptional regulator
MANGQEQQARRRRSATARRRRLPPETARAKLLAAGLELVAEQAVGEALGHLRINDLAERGGLTSGAFYHYWDSQEAYRREVLDGLLGGRRVDAEPGLLDGIDATDPLEDVVAATVDRTASRLRADPHQGAALGLWAQDDPAARAHLTRRAREATAAWAVRLARVLSAQGLAPSPPWTLDALATVVVALIDGTAVQHHVDPEIPDEPLVPVVLALLRGATGPGTAPAPPAPDAPHHEGADAGDRRQRLVDLGIEAALEQPLGNALDHIRANDVARRLGLTIGAFYHYWDSQDDYRDDLVDALFAADRYVPPAEVAALGSHVDGAADLAEAVRASTTWYWSRAADHPDNRVHFGFAALRDPYISPRLAADDDELRRAWHGVVETLLDRFGRRLDPPLDAALVVRGVSTVMDGLILRHDLDPAGLGPDDEGWTLWGRAGLAMVEGGSSPAG